ncbi:MAG: hypothetical protein EPO28_01845, partial [Saprospiraceae bacterium]
MRLLLILWMTVFLLSGCKHSQKKIPRLPGIEIFFENATIEKESGDCAGDTGSCARVSLRFPMAKKGYPALTKAINDTLLTCLIQQLSLEKTAGPVSMAQLDSAAGAYIAEWQEERGDATESWQFLAEGEVVMQTDKVAVVFLSIRSCSGGALPGTSVTTFNFDLKTGKTLRLEDFITNLPSLQIAANKKWKFPDSGDGLITTENAQPRNFELRHDGIYFWNLPPEYGFSSPTTKYFALT